MCFQNRKEWLNSLHTDLSRTFPHLLFFLPYCLISVQQQNAQRVQITEQLRCSQTEYRPCASAATKGTQTGNPMSHQWPLQGEGENSKKLLPGWFFFFGLIFHVKNASPMFLNELENSYLIQNIYIPFIYALSSCLWVSIKTLPGIFSLLLKSITDYIKTQNHILIIRSKIGKILPPQKPFNSPYKNALLISQNISLITKSINV